MSDGLHISDDLTLPTEAVTQTFALLAIRGSGKTYTASVMVEEMVTAGLPVVVMDPIGVWWGLRSNAAGDGPGLPVSVLGGDHGDVPIAPTDGEVIAELVADQRPPLVIDLSLMRKGEQQHFVTDFAEALYHRNRQPVHLVLDEADSWIPQRPVKGQERMVGAIEDLVRRGRARGVGVTLITQRPAVIHKDVLTQVQVLVALRMVAPHDRDAIDTWVRAHGTPEQRDELMASLPSLPVGQAWFWSPGWLDLFKRVRIRKRQTFDSSATPKVGEVRVEPRALAPIDLSALRERLSATVERIEADDPKALKRRIAELERVVTLPPPPPPPTVKIKQITTVPIWLAREFDVLVMTGKELATQIEQMQTTIETLASQGDDVGNEPPDVTAPLVLPAINSTPRADEPPRANGHARRLRSGQRRILEALARRYPGELTLAQLGALAKLTPSGGTFAAYYGELKEQGYIANGTGDIAITPAGFAVLDRKVPVKPTTPAETLLMWREALPATAVRMLDAVVAAAPTAMNRYVLAERVGLTSSGGTFGAHFGALRKYGLIEVAGDEVRAAAELVGGNTG